MTEKTQKILVTGATGFLGSYVVRTLLDQGYTDITALKRGDSDMLLVRQVEDRLKWLVGDILDVPFLYEALKETDVVIHTAATVTFDPRVKRRMQQVNIEGTANMVHAALENKVKKFIHISSIAAIGRSKLISEISEKTAWTKSRYNTFYGITKHHAELEVYKGNAEGLHTVILNPSFIIGAGVWSSSTCSVFGKIDDGLQFYPKGINGFVDVRDVALAVVKAVETEVNGQRFIISAENLTYQDFLGRIAGALGVPPPDKPLHAFLRGLSWRMEWIRTFITGKTPLLTKESVRSTSTRTTYDNANSREVLGMEYRSVDQSIKETAHAFLADKSSGIAGSVLPL